MRSLAENLKKAKENKKGFTLVEIIVVLVIIGILASLMYGSGNYAITVEAGKVISVSVTDSGIKKTCTITDGTIKIE